MLLYEVSSLISVTMKSNLSSLQAKAWCIPLAEWWCLSVRGFVIRSAIRQVRSAGIGVCLIVSPLAFHLHWWEALCKSDQLTAFLIVFLLTHQFLFWHSLYWHISPLLRANHVSFRIINTSLWHKQVNIFNKLTIVQSPSFPWLHLRICSEVH